VIKKERGKEEKEGNEEKEGKAKRNRTISHLKQLYRVLYMS
jgi:hypothetical protein